MANKGVGADLKVAFTPPHQATFLPAHPISITLILITHSKKSAIVNLLTITLTLPKH